MFTLYAALKHRRSRSTGRFQFLCLVKILLLVFELLVIVDGGLLVLLLLEDQVVHVGLILVEFYLVHALPGVPVEEGLIPNHGSELLRDPLEQLQDGGGVIRWPPP